MLATAGRTIAGDELRPRRRAASGLRAARREMDAENFVEADGGYTTGRKRTGLRLTFHGGLPETVWGRVATGAAFLVMGGLVFAGVLSAEHLVLRDRRFVVPDSAAIRIDGLHHLSRADVLRSLDGTVGQNVFRLSLDAERARLEAMPWVEHATVMRLLPNHLSTSITERIPVAFARNGNRVDLVDGTGVLLSMSNGTHDAPHYSFPVVTGIAPASPLSVRSSRMKIFSEFTAALDAQGDHLSNKLSEVDLSNPEDIKAVIPETGGDVLVHFGDSEYLERFRRFEKLLPDWRAQYPKLASVDMRYERQVVLEMQPGTSTDSAASSTGSQHVAEMPATPKRSTSVAKRPDVKSPRVAHPEAAHRPARAAVAKHHTAVPR